MEVGLCSLVSHDMDRNSNTTAGGINSLNLSIAENVGMLLKWNSSRRNHISKLR